VEEKVKTGYRVVIDSHCDESSYPSEPYGDWSESWSHYFRSIHLLGSGQHSDVNSDHSFNVGDHVYVVWLEYSSGDSFGWANSKYVSVVGVLKTQEAADEFEAWINHTKEEDGNIFESSDGQTIEVYRSWVGYFESLETVHIQSTLIEPATERNTYY
jgi:hypothetical protein